MNIIVYLLAFGIFGIVMTEFSVIGILPDIAAHFNISIQKAGWLLSLFAIVVAVTAPFSTLLTARINRKTLLATALVIFASANAIAAFAPNFEVMLIARMLPALAHPIFWAVSTALAASSVRESMAPRAVSIVYAGLSVATVIGVPTASWLAQRYGWEAAFVANSAVNVISLICLILWMPSMPVVGTNQRTDLQLLKNPQQWVNLLTSLCITAGLFSTYGYFAQYLQQITHMNGMQTSLMLFLFGLTGVAGNYLMGRLLSYSVLITARLSFISLMAIHIALFLWGGNYSFMVFLIIVWGFVHTGNFLLAGIIAMKDAGDARGFATSLFASFANLGVFLGTMLGGLMIQISGVRDTVWVTIILLTLALIGTWIHVTPRFSRTRYVS